MYYVGANLYGGWLNVSFNVKQPIKIQVVAVMTRDPES